MEVSLGLIIICGSVFILFAVVYILFSCLCSGGGNKKSKSKGSSRAVPGGATDGDMFVLETIPASDGNAASSHHCGHAQGAGGCAACGGGGGCGGCGGGGCGGGGGGGSGC
ncbi:hypothetical protein DCAR_0935586 [Daucus carota subsp. sativus]|uniref:Uncharacterized protein n=1 Tax=Daucus carota subsp. sativus TaxID=79200 RepID=A0A175YHA0_DAUCS|nr:hypothetical protein DCAR_0935586 [Daucus carota subsp. sativus]